MTKIFTILFSFICSQAFASSTLSQLYSVNTEWRTKTHYVSIANTINESVHAGNHTDWIKVHLLATVQVLGKANTKKLTASQLCNRTRLIAVLQQYALAEKFPINNYLPYTNPVFIDKIGTHCAVGYLMQQSGSEALAQSINASQQFAYIKDIHRADVTQWARNNGFKINELAMIQPSYASTQNIDKIAEGVNGAVRCMAQIDNNTFIIGGDFTKELKNNSTCNHIALITNYNNNWEINPILNGVNGPVNVLYNYDNKIIIGGDFTNANGVAVNNLATYNIIISSQPFAAFGSFDGAVNCITTYDNQLFVGGNFTEHIKYFYNNTWSLPQNNNLLGTAKINAFKIFNNELYIGGDFELLTGALRKNVLKYTTSLGMLSSGFGSPTPINDFEIFNNKLFAACTFVKGTDTCALAVLDSNDGWQVAIKPSVYNALTGKSFETLLQKNGTLYVGGNYVNIGMMDYGKNMGEIIFYNNTYNHVPLLTIDSSIYGFFETPTQLFLLGDFIANQHTSGNQQLNKIGILELGPSTIGVIKNDFIFSIYPNPTNGIINITSDLWLQNADCIIYDMQGSIVLKNKVNDNKINVSQLSNEMYQLIINKGDKKSSVLFQKK